MPELDLPSGPRELFAAVRQPLAQAFGGEEHIRFGGGTALAARWTHRHSIDVDLFVADEPYRDFHWNTGARFTLNLTASASVERMSIRSDGAEITLHGHPGHVSVVPARGLPDDPRSTDTPRHSRMPFETTAEILGKKLLYRMSQNQIIISQDLYDLAVARSRDPDSLRTALDHVRPEELRRILVAFDDHAASGRSLEPLIDPSDPQLERDAPGIIHKLIQRESDHRPPSGPQRGPAFEPTR